jgi:1,4-alpha-glucan branching enzyme
MFMGCEFGQWREWNYDESLDWHLLDDPMHAGLRRWVQDLNHTYQCERSLHEIDFEGTGFSWIDCNDNENSVISLIRRARDPHDFTVIVANFTPVARQAYRIGVPEGGWYREALDSDAAVYGGGNVGNGGGVMAEPIPAHGFPHSLSLVVPPLGFLLFKK